MTTLKQADIFERAVILPPGERLAWVAEICGEDSALRARV